MEFETNEKYTLISISEMAFTSKTEITIKEKHERGFIFVHKGKRKQYILNLSEDKLTRTLIFKDWNIPLKLDSEIEFPKSEGCFTTKKFSGNALINLVCENEKETRFFIDKYNLNPKVNKGLIVFKTLKQHLETDTDGKPLYLEEAKKTNHAVMERIISKSEVLKC